LDGHSFAGFRARGTVRGVFGDPDVRIVRLDRRSKKRFAAVAGGSGRGGTTGGCGTAAIVENLGIADITAQDAAGHLGPKILKT
jgi:hypothetical protein